MLLFSISSYAQEKKHLDLEDVMNLAYHNSSDAKVIDAKVKARQLEYEASKDSQLPEAKLSGSYLFLNSPTVDLKIPIQGGGKTPDIKMNQLFLGQLSVNMPIYTGGKIKNSIKSAEDSWKSSELQAVAEKQNLAIQGMHLYVALYKAQQTTQLIAENIKKAEQQVVDFKAMEQNGVIARNDLLKAELQLSNYKVSYQEALKNVNVLSYQLSVLLGLDENTNYDNIQLAASPSATLLSTNPHDRYEIKSLEAQKDVAEDQLQVTKSAYHPTVFATGGYAAVQMHNLLTVTNAANIGLGVSYDIAALYKNKKKVNLAKQHIEEVNQNLTQAQDKIKTQIQASQQEVILAKQKQQLYQEACLQANENYRIVKDKYNNGVADTDDLLEADVQQLQSKINLAIGDATIVEKYYDLLLASGQLQLK